MLSSLFLYSGYTFWLPLFFYFFFLPLAKSEVIIQQKGNTLAVSTDQIGHAGFKGCDAQSAKKVPAYIFVLQHQKSAACGAKSVGQWQTLERQESTKNQTVFNTVPDGRYRVVCYTGQAVGCAISGDTESFPNRSIVYEKEVSQIIDGKPLSSNTPKNQALATTTGQLTLFPNPASQQLTVQLEQSDLEKQVEVRLINLLGQAVYQKEYTLEPGLSSYTWTIPTSSYESGTYFVQLIDLHGRQLQQKVIILHTK